MNPEELTSMIHSHNQNHNRITMIWLS